MSRFGGIGWSVLSVPAPGLDQILDAQESVDSSKGIGTIAPAHKAIWLMVFDSVGFNSFGGHHLHWHVRFHAMVSEKETQ